MGEDVLHAATELGAFGRQGSNCSSMAICSSDRPAIVECRHPVRRKMWIASGRAGERCAFTISCAYDLLMPALSANSPYGMGALSIPISSHGAKFSSSASFRSGRDEGPADVSYHADMPRKSDSQQAPKAIRQDWYLIEWMKALRMSQAKLARECDWSASTMHGVYHGRTAYYREIVNLIADKLHIEPYELLMPPEVAFALRRQREDSMRIVSNTEPLRRAEG